MDELSRSTYSLMQDPDGRIGAFNIIDPLTHAIIATVTTTDNVYTLTPPTAAGINALSNQKTAQEVAQGADLSRRPLFPVFLANPCRLRAIQPAWHGRRPERLHRLPGSSTTSRCAALPEPMIPPPAPPPGDRQGGYDSGSQTRRGCLG